MRPLSTWERILSAPSTSLAIERAALVPFSELPHIPLPAKFPQLSDYAQRNLLAVIRALGLNISGVSNRGWDVWKPTESEQLLNVTATNVLSKRPTPCPAEDGFPLRKRMRQTHDVQQSKRANCSSPEILDKQGNVGRNINSEDKIDVINTDAQLLPVKNALPDHDVDKPPSTEQIKCAKEVKKWALLSSHTDPPADAVAQVTRAANASKLLSIMMQSDASPTLRATIIATFSENVGSTFAGQLMKTLVIPYVSQLKAPASREIMQAIVSFCEMHWRAAVTLFQSFITDKNAVNGAIAEVLVRVSAVITVEGGMQCLSAYCNSPWGEDGIRVVEALLTRCKDEQGIAAILIPSLERNVLGLEKSVRFGKLLFTTAKDVSGILGAYEETMESIATRSKVFLAKRALSLLRSKAKAA